MNGLKMAMKQRVLIEQLTDGVAAAMRSTNFCVSGDLPNIDPAIEVEGLGRLKLPLGPTAAKRLAAICQPAAYGKGTKTLVDRSVRDAMELNPEKFTITNREWTEMVSQTLASVAEQLGLPPEQLTSELYKLLYYRPGGFFLPHRDSEKRDRMVASLIIALPNPFSGGWLVVRHHSESRRFEFDSAAHGRSPSFAAFYADCEHEVISVTHGFRLCLAYNLVLASNVKRKLARKPAAEATNIAALARSMSQWAGTNPHEPLVFALDHHYTSHGLSLDLLKGNDRGTADLVSQAADEADCLVYLCHVERHTSQQADDGSYGRRWRYDDPMPDKLELGEIYEDELKGTEWFDLAGEKQAFPEIPLATAAIVASQPLDEWTPTTEEYEGFTGNAGNTLDRWYHRSAVCVWRADDHFAVLAGASIRYAADLLASMMLKMSKTPRAHRAVDRKECLRLARAIVERWPKTYSYLYSWQGDKDDPLADVPERVIELDDLELARQLLTAAVRDPSLKLSRLVVAYCDKYGTGEFATELEALVKAPEQGIRPRDLMWLDKLARSDGKDPERERIVAALAGVAAERFCLPLGDKRYYREDPVDPQQTLPLLIRVLLVTGDDASLAQVIEFVTADPRRFSLETVQIPALEKLLKPGRLSAAAANHKRITQWLQRLQGDLATATASAPQPPDDWVRPAEIDCTCDLCGQLKSYLADPNAPTFRLRAAEYGRDHVTAMIKRRQCDLTYQVDKKTRPFALEFQKTDGSYQRQVKRYEADLELLAVVQHLLAICQEGEKQRQG